MSEFAQGLIAGIMALLLTIQFIRPAKTNPPIVRERTLEAAVDVPPDVEAILAKSCDDCHSNRTEWPWYSNVAPVSFFVTNHVNEGRRHLNFSEWLPPGAGDPAAYTFERLNNVCKSVQSESMPLKSYTFIHRQATLSQEDIEKLCAWSRNRLPGSGDANLRIGIGPAVSKGKPPIGRLAIPGETETDPRGMGEAMMHMRWTGRIPCK